MENWRAEQAIAGSGRALEALRELIIYPFLFAKESQKLGLKWPRGLLLFGPPGTGKTSLVQAAVRECDAYLTLIKKEQDSRIVGQLLTLMDGIRTSSKSVHHIVVVASTNRVNGIDPALRRHGRFDAEIEVTFPTVEKRLQILELHSKNLHLDHDVDLQVIPASCNGYVGADLEALCREAVRFASRRVSGAANDGSLIKLAVEDWERARSEVGPSLTRGATKEFKRVAWDDIGGHNNLKKKLQQAVEWRIKHADAFARQGISPLSGAELYSKYVGEGEELLRRTFQKARLAAPSIIFFDEADAVAPKRGHGGDSDGNDTVGERLLSTLLTEMDGLEEATGVIVLAATNRPRAIDDALMRPGRFDLVLCVPPPDREGRYEILRIHTRQMRLGEDVDLMRVAECTDLYTGADLEGLCREAGMVALREDITANVVLDRHFQAARDSLAPSLKRAKIEEYSSMQFAR